MEVKIDANIDPSENVKIELPSKRESTNQGLEGIEKALKIDVKTMLPRSSKNHPKIALWGVLGHRCDAKGLQGVSGHPPRLKMEPKWSQNGTNNYTKTIK